MKGVITALIISAIFWLAVATAAYAGPISDEEAFDRLHIEVGAETYNLVCDDHIYVPQKLMLGVTAEQRAKHWESGRFDASFDYWLSYINRNNCQTTSKYWASRGVL